MKYVRLGILVAASLTQPVLAKTCIDIRDIASSTPAKGGASILFTMKNGRQWRNDLQSGCPSLDFAGFAWTFRGTTEVCDGEKSIRVLRSGEICKLGNFSEVPSVRK
jgi:hypothetical protein